MNVKITSVEYRKMPLPNGNKVNYVHQGNGEPVILIHGLAASLHDWDDLLPELERAGYAGYALDLLGHGESEKPVRTRDYSVENAYADFAEWLDLLDFRDPLILIGHSLGAGISMMYAQRNPERVRTGFSLSP
ncbi:MAG: hypothetical protein JETCAE01_03630 [Anaerolineaceae bacterium]|nr:MAG: hypothetical protein JETCAE01_03630 [Anaerolineaceae bacterium]